MGWKTADPKEVRVELRHEDGECRIPIVARKDNGRLELFIGDLPPRWRIVHLGRAEKREREE